MNRFSLGRAIERLNEAKLINIVERKEDRAPVVVRIREVGQRNSPDGPVVKFLDRQGNRDGGIITPE